jgi:lysozyme family protein
LSNLATAGAGAIAGLFGLLVDGLDAMYSAGTYQITFALAAVIVAVQILLLRQLDRRPESPRSDRHVRSEAHSPG